MPRVFRGITYRKELTTRCTSDSKFRCNVHNDAVTREDSSRYTTCLFFRSMPYNYTIFPFTLSDNLEAHLEYRNRNISVRY